MLQNLIIIFHLLAAFSVIVLVLIQHGKGADMGASFGSGASATVFGSQGSANFLSRATAILAAIFFVTSVGLTYYANKASSASIISAAPVQQQITDKEETTTATTEQTTEAASTNSQIDAEHEVELAPAPVATDADESANKTNDKK